MTRPTRTSIVRLPCGQDWDSFTGDQRRRHCRHCDKAVHDLTTMTRPEAEVLLDQSSSEGVCVRYRQDEHGRILVRSERYPGRHVWKRLRR